MHLMHSRVAAGFLTGMECTHMRKNCAVLHWNRIVLLEAMWLQDSIARSRHFQRSFLYFAQCFRRYNSL